MNRGKVHDYLGMDIKYSKQGTVKLSMIKYLDSVIQEFPENLGATAITKVAEPLFKVRDDRKTQYLTEEQAQTFHHTVAQLLFMISRA